MGKLKKALAMALTFAMTLAMGLTSFAADGDGKITVTAPEGATITSDKIVEEDRTSIYGWKFVDKYKADFVDAYLNGEQGDADTVIADLIRLGKLENLNQHAIAGTVNGSAALGRALEAIQDELAASSAEITPDGIGLYAIKAAKEGHTFIPMSVYVGTGFTGVSVTAKGAQDQIEKIVDESGQSVSKGDKIPYTVSTEYPYYSENAENKMFTITDTLENASFEDDMNLKVSIGGNQVDTGYEVTVSKAKNVLTIEFTYDAQYAGKRVVISYQATAGEVSSEKPVKNKATSTIATGATEYEVESDTVRFEVTKVDTEHPNQGLAGAVFTLYEADAEGNITLKYNGNDVKVKKTSDSAATDADGKTVFDGLDAQKTYYVKETKAPEGYSLNDTVYLLTGAEANDPEVTEGKDGNVTMVKTKYTFTDFSGQTVKDTTLSSLPSTGGIGTTIFTIAGCITMAAAVFLFFALRKKSAE